MFCVVAGPFLRIAFSTCTRISKPAWLAFWLVLCHSIEGLKMRKLRFKQITRTRHAQMTVQNLFASLWSIALLTSTPFNTCFLWAFPSFVHHGHLKKSRSARAYLHCQKRCSEDSRFVSAHNTHHDWYSPPQCWCLFSTGRPFCWECKSKSRRVGASHFRVPFSLVH